MSIVSRFSLLLLLAVTVAACDSGEASLEDGEFLLTLDSDDFSDLDGAQIQGQATASTGAVEGSGFATQLFLSAGDDSFDIRALTDTSDPLRTGTYPLSGRSGSTDADLLARLGRQNYRVNGVESGDLRITRSTADRIEGTITAELDVTPTGNGSASGRATVSGRFVALQSAP